MTIAYSGDSITFPDSSVQATAPKVGMVNRIINGAMVIDQRNAGASVTLGAGGTYTLDRWRFLASQASKLSTQQNQGAITPPTGFKNYISITSSSAYAITATDYFFVQQPVEGFNSADFGWGTLSAASITVSFWVRSSLTGTFGGSILNGAFNRAYPFTYTINTANTWEQKAVTIAGDTSGTWASDNSVGLRLSFSFGAGSTYSGTAGTWASAELYSATGSVSVVGTNAATWQVTGVQLEKGSTATSFDYRPYGTELGLCQRYYWQTAIAGGGTVGGAGTVPRISFSYPQLMRATPTLAYVSNGSFSDGIINVSVTAISSTNPSAASASIETNLASGTSANSRGCSIYGLTIFGNAEL